MSLDGTATINDLINAINDIEKELGIDPMGVYGDVRARLDIIEARINNPNAASPNVEDPFIIGNNGVTISTGIGAPTENRVDGSLYLRRDGYSNDGIYIHLAGEWKNVMGSGAVVSRVVTTVYGQGNSDPSQTIFLSDEDALVFFNVDSDNGLLSLPETSTNGRQITVIGSYLAGTNVAWVSACNTSGVPTYPIANGTEGGYVWKLEDGYASATFEYIGGIWYVDAVSSIVPTTTINVQSATISGPGVTTLTVAQGEADYLNLTGTPGSDTGVAFHASTTRPNGTHFIIYNNTDSPQTITDLAASDFITMSSGEFAEVVWKSDVVGGFGVVSRSGFILASGTSSQVVLGNGAFGNVPLAALDGGLSSTDLYSNRPSAGTNGRIYVPTEYSISVDNGTIWRPLINGRLGNSVLLTDLSSTIGSNPGYTDAQLGDAIITTTPAWSGAGGFANFCARLKSGTSNATTRVYAVGNITKPIFYHGAILRESATGKAATVSSATIGTAGWVGVTTGIWSDHQHRTSYTDLEWLSGMATTYVRIEVDGGTGAKCYVGLTPNGPWILVATLAGVFSTAPDQIGIFSASESGTSTAIFEHFEGS